VNPLKFRNKHGPEWHIQQDLIEFLSIRKWCCEVTNGNVYQIGFPDLYVAHKKYGTRWIDCKNPERYTFTGAQKEKWPLWHSYGIGIWIITGATEKEYDKLFQPPNWQEYWKKEWTEDSEAMKRLVEELRNATD
jgi:hypothetical protein